jgi:hypothetical protein
MKTENEKPMALPLTVKWGLEEHDGKRTGENYFTAEIQWPYVGASPGYLEASRKTLSVLGRSTRSAIDAVADWTRRANLDGHNVRGVQVELRKA